LAVVDELIDWIIEKDKAGYQMVNRSSACRRPKRLSHVIGLDLKKYAGTAMARHQRDLSAMLAHTPGIAQDAGGSCISPTGIAGPAEQLIIRTDGTVAPCSRCTVDL